MGRGSGGPRRLVKVVLVAELLSLCGAYGLFKLMNSSRDFRRRVKATCPPILEGYYQSNEWAGLYGLRERDQEAWAEPRG